MRWVTGTDGGADAAGNLTYDGPYQYRYDTRWRPLEDQHWGGYVRRQYVWGARYIDELVQIAVNEDPDDANESVCERDYYALTNSNFNVMGLVDANGELLERYEYTPYGQRTVYKKSGPDDALTIAPLWRSQRVVTSDDEEQPYGLNDIGHQGLPHDDESGLIYDRYRFIVPRLGRNAGPQRGGRFAGANPYRYAESSPANQVVPLGTRLPKRIPGESHGAFVRRADEEMKEKPHPPEAWEGRMPSLEIVSWDKPYKADRSQAMEAALPLTEVRRNRRRVSKKLHDLAARFGAEMHTEVRKEFDKVGAKLGGFDTVGTSSGWSKSAFAERDPRTGMVSVDAGMSGFMHGWTIKAEVEKGYCSFPGTFYRWMGFYALLYEEGKKWYVLLNRDGQLAVDFNITTDQHERFHVIGIPEFTRKHLERKHGVLWKGSRGYQSAALEQIQNARRAFKKLVQGKAELGPGKIKATKENCAEKARVILDLYLTSDLAVTDMMEAGYWHLGKPDPSYLNVVPRRGR